MGLNVLSLFDGMSCGRIALERLGFEVDNYYSSEIDKHAIKVSEDNYDDIIRLGDVTKHEDWDIDWNSIDLILAGSPCQGFSLSGKGLAFEDERSKLYFVFEEVLSRCKKDVKFLLENVRMKKEHLDVITDRLGVTPIFINSRLLSAQNRPRYYWTNIEGVELPTDKHIYLNDILMDHVDDKYFIKNGRLRWLTKFGEVKDKAGYVAFNPDKAKCLTVRGEPH